MEKQEQLALEITELAKKASTIIGNPNATEFDNQLLQNILEELNQKKIELREIANNGK